MPFFVMDWTGLHLHLLGNWGRGVASFEKARKGLSFVHTVISMKVSRYFLLYKGLSNNEGFWRLAM